jgi:hypothetical protein
MQTHTASSADLAAALRAIAAPKAKKTDQAVTVALDHVMTLRGSAPGVHEVPSTRIGGGALLEAAVDLAALLKLTQTLGGSLELSVIPGRYFTDGTDLLVRQGRYSCQLYGRTPHARVRE